MTRTESTGSTHNTYAPYRKEAICCLIIDLVIAISLVLLLLLARAGWFLVPILPIFFAVTFFLNYLTPLRIRREMRGELYETATLEVREVKEVFSAAGYWGTILKEVYPKALRVGHRKLICCAEDGSRVVLHSIMSADKERLLREGIDQGQTKKLCVTYGKQTHILLGCNDRGELADMLNHKL